MVTVIVPVYNVEAYLDKCVESIVNQTYTKIEIILVNDGSTDSSGEICDKWSEKDSRVKVIHKENGGLSSARNAGLDQARGKYICFIDSDDWVELDFVKLLVNYIEKYDADISQCGFVEEVVGEEALPYRSENYVVTTGKDAIKRLYNRETYLNTVIMCNKLYKNKIFKELRFDEGIHHEDEALIHEVLYNADKVVINESALYHYVTRPNSIMNSQFSLKRLDSIYAYEKRITYLKSKEEHELVRMTMRMYFRVLLEVSSNLFYSDLTDREYYLNQTTQKIDTIITELDKNKYLNKVDKVLLTFYKMNNHLGFFMNRNMNRVKNIKKK